MMDSASSGEGWEVDLARRLEQARPAHTVRGLFLQSYLEQLRALGGEELLKQGLALCEHTRPVELFRYPVHTQLQLLSLLMPHLVAQHGEAAAGLRALGHLCINHFLSSYTGQLLLRLGGRDPNRILNHVPLGYQLASGFGKHTLRWRGPRHCHWAMTNQYLPRAYHEGVFQGILEHSDARAVRVAGHQTALLDSEYDISWD